GLDHTLIAELLHITLGIAPKQSLTQMEAMALDLEGLSIDDLTLAIRPARSLQAILAILATLGEQARTSDEDDDSKDGDHRTNDRSGRETKSKTRKSVSNGTGNTASPIDGVDIVQPIKPPDSVVEQVDVQVADENPAVDSRLHHV